MGTSKCSHLGAYLSIKINKLTEKRKRKRCPKNNGHSTLYKYCPDCGSEIETYEIEEKYYPSLYDILYNLKLDEPFCDVFRKGDAVIAIGNNSEKNKETEYNLDESDNDIHQIVNFDRPEQMVKNFKTNYKEEIDALNGHYAVSSVEVCFGYLIYFM